MNQTVKEQAVNHKQFRTPKDAVSASRFGGCAQCAACEVSSVFIQGTDETLAKTLELTASETERPKRASKRDVERRVLLKTSVSFR